MCFKNNLTRLFFLFVQILFVFGSFERRTACEGQSMILKCTQGSRIFLNQVFFGRQDSQKCIKGRSIVPEGGCRSSKPHKVIARDCHGRLKCTIRSSVQTFGDPCPGVSKYLSVVYMCLNEKYFVKKKACAKGSLRMKCPLNSKIFVGYTFYGRKRNFSYADENVSHLNGVCRADDAYDSVSRSCNGRTWCTLNAGRITNKDPCVNKTKCLEVIFSCVFYKRVRKKTTCEGDIMQLKCPINERLLISNVFYGRRQERKCLIGNYLVPMEGCSSNRSRNLVMDRCHSSRNCSISVNNHTFGDLCVGTSKYLTVDYSCVKTREAISCENGSILLHCPRGQFISILSSFFGRVREDICLQQFSASSLGGCQSENAWKAVTAQCNSRNLCKLWATVGLFSDPCPGISKYLLVRYSCIKKVKT